MMNGKGRGDTRKVVQKGLQLKQTFMARRSENNPPNTNPHQSLAPPDGKGTNTDREGDVRESKEDNLELVKTLTDENEKLRKQVAELSIIDAQAKEIPAITNYSDDSDYKARYESEIELYKAELELQRSHSKVEETLAEEVSSCLELVAAESDLHEQEASIHFRNVALFAHRIEELQKKYGGLMTTYVQTEQQLEGSIKLKIILKDALTELSASCGEEIEKLSSRADTKLILLASKLKSLREKNLHVILRKLSHRFNKGLAGVERMISCIEDKRAKAYTVVAKVNMGLEVERNKLRVDVDTLRLTNAKLLCDVKQASETASSLEFVTRAMVAEKARNVEHERHCSDLELQLQKSKAETVRWVETAQSLEANAKADANEMQEHRNHISELRLKVGELEKSLSDISADRDRVLTVAKDSSSEADYLKRVNLELEEELEKNSEMLSEARKASAETVMGLEQELRESRRELDRLRVTTEDMEKERQRSRKSEAQLKLETEKKMQELLVRVEGMDAQHKRDIDDLAAMRDQLKNSELAQRQMQASLSALKNELTNAQRELTSTKDQIERNKMERQQMELQSEELEQNLRLERDKVRDLQDELGAEKIETEYFKDIAELLAKEILPEGRVDSELAGELELYKRELVDTLPFMDGAGVTSLYQIIEGMQNRLDVLQADNDKYREQLTNVSKGELPSPYQIQTRAQFRSQVHANQQVENLEAEVERLQRHLIEAEANLQASRLTAGEETKRCQDMLEKYKASEQRVETLINKLNFQDELQKSLEEELRSAKEQLSHFRRGLEIESSAKAVAEKNFAATAQRMLSLLDEVIPPTADSVNSSMLSLAYDSRVHPYPNPGPNPGMIEDQIRKRVSKVKDHVYALNDRVIEAENREAELSGEVLDLKRAIAERDRDAHQQALKLQQALNQVQQQSQLQLMDTQRRDARLDSLVEDCKKKTALLDESERRRVEKEREVEDTKRRMKAAIAEKDGLLASNHFEMARVKAEVQDLQHRLEEEAHEVRNLKRQLNDLREASEDLQKRAKEAEMLKQAEIEKLKTQLHREEIQLEAMSEKCENLEVEVKTLQEDKVAAESDLRLANMRLENSQAMANKEREEMLSNERDARDQLRECMEMISQSLGIISDTYTNIVTINDAVMHTSNMIQHLLDSRSQIQQAMNQVKKAYEQEKKNHDHEMKKMEDEREAKFSEMLQEMDAKDEELENLHRAVTTAREEIMARNHDIHTYARKCRDLEDQVLANRVFAETALALELKLKQKLGITDDGQGSRLGLGLLANPDSDRLSELVMRRLEGLESILEAYRAAFVSGLKTVQQTTHTEGLGLVPRSANTSAEGEELEITAGRKPVAVELLEQEVKFWRGRLQESEEEAGTILSEQRGIVRERDHFINALQERFRKSTLLTMEGKSSEATESLRREVQNLREELQKERAIREKQSRRHEEARQRFQCEYTSKIGELMDQLSQAMSARDQALQLSANLQGHLKRLQESRPTSTQQLQEHSRAVARLEDEGASMRNRMADQARVVENLTMQLAEKDEQLRRIERKRHRSDPPPSHAQMNTHPHTRSPPNPNPNPTTSPRRVSSEVMQDYSQDSTPQGRVSEYVLAARGGNAVIRTHREPTSDHETQVRSRTRDRANPNPNADRASPDIPKHTGLTRRRAASAHGRRK